MSVLQNPSFEFPQQQHASQPTYARKPYGDIGDFVKQLTVDFANYFGDPVNASFDLRPGRVLTYNVSSLSNAGKWFAKKALAAWGAATGIKFNHVKASNADIKFVQNDQSGAYAASSYNSKGEIVKSKVNIPKSWYKGEEFDLGSYGYQTFLHEIGHALGLGHAGNYNGSGGFQGDARFSNDSWQMTVMSYFSQTENPNVTGSFAYVLTPMPADLAGIHKLYGVPSGVKKVNTGETTWGFDSNAKGPAKLFAATKPVGTMTIFDQGGEDTMDFSKTGKNQKIDLNPQAFSNVLGKTKNIQIERSTWIENAKTGNGYDNLYGNTLGNDLHGGGRADFIAGRDGNDRLYGQSGNDTIRGGEGGDFLFGALGADKLFGNQGNDYLRGGPGADFLTGGEGNDDLVGSEGADTFLFTSGNDNILDFDDSERDAIEIDADLVSTSDVTQFLTDNATIVNGNTVITFGNGDTLTIHGVNNALDLADDISFV
ncbi:M10 family metallopeptidase [Aliiroseovarius sp. F20344]|uniref:M10 family metallopeptidase n=1 Tax=Aliiroseovarius sp. F20344 TaxID=2926414 RepID=UPI001FF3DDF7|nr:M10 family metallopeptidase [Aliiroseovarius sp. F20344]MCK0141039.1 M10 family metallopeptidase C-terminal domain-containing protein [Aliiroseovarius sp. F20344]